MKIESKDEMDKRDSGNPDRGCVRDGALPGVGVVLALLVEEEIAELVEGPRATTHSAEIGIAVDPVRWAFKLRAGIVYRAPQADDDPTLQILQDPILQVLLDRFDLILQIL